MLCRAQLVIFLQRKWRALNPTTAMAGEATLLCVLLGVCECAGGLPCKCCGVYGCLCGRMEGHDALCRTVLGLAGDDFAILAGDTRLSTGYSILSRDQPKSHQLYAQQLNLTDFVLGIRVSVVKVYFRLCRCKHTCLSILAHVTHRTPTAVLGCAGFHGDVLTFTKLVKQRIVEYSYIHDKNMR
jgi:hypothetical protein